MLQVKVLPRDPMKATRDSLWIAVAQVGGLKLLYLYLTRPLILRQSHASISLACCDVSFDFRQSVVYT